MLGSRVWGSRSRGAQALDERRHDGFVALRAHDLDLDLAKSSRDAAAVTHRDLVVDDLRDAAAVGADQADPTAHRRQARDRYQLRSAYVGAHQGQGGGRRLLGPALKRDLVTLEHSLLGLPTPAAFRGRTSPRGGEARGGG